MGSFDALPQLCGPSSACKGSPRAASLATSVCFEPADTKNVANFPFVGKGKGAYEQIRTYRYVGRGEGSYDQFEADSGQIRGSFCRRCCGWCFLACVFALVAGIAYLGKAWMMVEGSGGHNMSDSQRSPDDDHDCEDDSAAWTSQWPKHKRAWCCLHKRVGCPTSTTEAPYTCEVHTEQDKHVYWSVNHKAWCCEHKHVACPTLPRQTSTSARIRSPTHAAEKPAVHKQTDRDCNAGFADWLTAWAPQKMQYCCDKVNRGCLPEFDCDAGFANWAKAWSPAKRLWCCRERGRGCEATTFDCDVGVEKNRQPEWSVGQQAWCCERVGRGCPETADEYDCKAGLATWALGWSPEKKKWCCDHRQEGRRGGGCPSKPGSAPSSEVAASATTTGLPQRQGGLALAVEAVKDGPLGELLRR